MSDDLVWRPGRLQELSEDECRELLRTRQVGRVAFVNDTGPTVVPVNFVLAENAIVFRTSPHSEMAQQLNGRRVAFEVDDVDDFNQSGWSVLVRGTGRFVESPTALSEAARPDTWAEGVRTLFVRIEIDLLTGRRLLGT
jgi:uncharacterized protein